MEKVYKHITIFESEEIHNDKPIYGIVNTKNDSLLGYITFEPAWKQFVFSSNRNDDIIFSVSCLNDIIDFIQNEIKYNE